MSNTAEEKRNLAVVAEYLEEYWGKGNGDIVDKVCTDDFVVNCPMHGPRYGKAEAKKMLRDFKRAFEDVSFSLYQHPMIASGPYVVARWIGGGTHTGTAFLDLPVGGLDKPNTGKKIRFSGISFYVVKDGKIADETVEEGALTALQQLGLVPGPNPGKEMKFLYE
ncbi:hypothetical protein NHJ13734_003248 [Beauveria thailandica]